MRGFNPRPCARGDLTLLMKKALQDGFNPRPCARGDMAILSYITK